MREEPIGPAYRVVTERLVLRCWDPRDAPLLKRAIDASLEHLLPWLDWARDEPQTLDAKVELLRHFRGRFDLGKDYVYAILDPAESEVLGGCGLHDRAGGEGREPGSGESGTREPRAREIGYWIAAAHAGQGLATEAAAALVRVGFEVLRLERVEIHCDPENARSAAVARKLGFRHDATLRARVPRRDGRLSDRMVWSMLAGELEHGPCARARVRVFDVLGRLLLDSAALDPAPGSPARRRSAFR